MKQDEQLESPPLDEILRRIRPGENGAIVRGVMIDDTTPCIEACLRRSDGTLSEILRLLTSQECLALATALEVAGTRLREIERLQELRTLAREGDRAAFAAALRNALDAQNPRRPD